MNQLSKSLTKSAKLVAAASTDKHVKTAHQKSKDEKIQLAKIIQLQSECQSADIWQKIHSQFQALTHETIVAIREVGGRGHHYDLIVQTETNMYQVEHKGSCHYTPISADDAPWKTGVQFYNGTASKFTVGHVYSRLWYDTYITTGVMSHEYDIVTPIPTYDEWKKDSFRQGTPATPFVKELRVKTDKGEKIKKSVFRANFVRDFDLTEEEKQQLITEVALIANECLSEKQLWLQVHGDLDGECHVHWSPKVDPIRITSVNIVKNKDVEFIFMCDDQPIIRSILRWGYGQGITNLRMDLK